MTRNKDLKQCMTTNLCLVLVGGLLLTGCGGRLVNAAADNDINRAKTLIEAGVDVNETIRGKFRALHNSTVRNSLEMTKLLIESGADVNVATSKGMTPLHNATGYNNLEITKLLIESGADVNVAASKGITPLHNATIEGNFEITKLLIESGADLDYLSLHGHSAFKLACLNDNFDVATYLYEKGADTNIEGTSDVGIELNGKKYHILGDYFLAQDNFDKARNSYGKAQAFYDKTATNYKKNVANLSRRKVLAYGLQTTLAVLQPTVPQNPLPTWNIDAMKANANAKAKIYLERSAMLGNVIDCLNENLDEADIHSCVDTIIKASGSDTQIKCQ